MSRLELTLFAFRPSSISNGKSSSGSLSGSDSPTASSISSASLSSIECCSCDRFAVEFSVKSPGLCSGSCKLSISFGSGTLWRRHNSRNKIFTWNKDRKRVATQIIKWIFITFHLFIFHLLLIFSFICLLFQNEIIEMTLTNTHLIENMIVLAVCVAKNLYGICYTCLLTFSKPYWWRWWICFLSQINWKIGFRFISFEIN